MNGLQGYDDEPSANQLMKNGDGYEYKGGHEVESKSSENGE